eukprot:PhF_6_TR41746/c0_g1_i1/m.63358
MKCERIAILLFMCFFAFRTIVMMLPTPLKPVVEYDPTITKKTPKFNARVLPNTTEEPLPDVNVSYHEGPERNLNTAQDRIECLTDRLQSFTSTYPYTSMENRMARVIRDIHQLATRADLHITPYHQTLIVAARYARIPIPTQELEFLVMRKDKRPIPLRELTAMVDEVLPSWVAVRKVVNDKENVVVYTHDKNVVLAFLTKPMSADTYSQRSRPESMGLCSLYSTEFECPIDPRLELKQITPECMLLPLCAAQKPKLPFIPNEACPDVHPAWTPSKIVKAAKALRRCGYVSLVDEVAENSLCKVASDKTQHVCSKEANVCLWQPVLKRR